MSGTVAKKASAALVLPGDFDGYTATDVLAFIEVAVASIKEQRSSFGVALWKLRQLLPRKEYEDALGTIADRLEVDIRTLYRWRIAAEAQHALAPPPRESRPEKVEDQDQVNGQNVREQEDPIKPTEVIPPASKGNEAPIESSKPAALIAKPATQLSLFEEREGRALVPARPPASREEVLEAKRIAKAYLDWAASASFDEPSAAPPKRANPYTSKPNHASNRRAPAAESTKAEKCLHPVTRRIGGNCAACGAKVGAK